MATQVYKTININDLKNRTVKPVTAADKIKVKQTITNFISYLKIAHS